MRVLGMAVLGPVQRLSGQVERLGRQSAIRRAGGGARGGASGGASGGAHNDAGRSDGAEGDALPQLRAQGARELQNLTGEINRLVEAVEAAKRAAVAASEAKSQFLANTSHEIRTPLNGVVGALELLMRTALDERQLRQARLAKFSADSLLQLLNDILDLSKIEAGAVELESIDLDVRDVVEDVALLCGPRASEQDIAIQTRVHPGLRTALRGDPLRLRQVLTNLVSNAVKFTNKGSVVIGASLDRSEQGRVIARFSVTDTGVGIPPDRLDRLFRNFSQVDASTTRRYGGTGLGLSISRQLVELMGGQIGVESELGRGSTFWFTVPLARAMAISSPQGITDDLRRSRLLVIAPPGPEREELRAAIEHWSLTMHCVDGPAQAPDTVRQWALIGQPFAAVLSLANAGATALTRLSVELAALDTTHTPALILVGTGDEREALDLTALGVVGWVDQPIYDGHLLDAITEAIVLVRAPHRGEAARLLERPSAKPASAGATPSAATTGPERAWQGAPSTEYNSGPRVLLVEDNEVNQLIATELLGEAGYRVTLARNGAEAVALFGDGTAIDAVLSDCQMPVMDGFEAAREMRLAEARRRAGGGSVRAVPIIALTANAQKADREAARDAGMDEFLTKPIDPTKLCETLSRFISQRGRATAPASVPGAPGVPGAPLELPAAPPVLGVAPVALATPSPAPMEPARAAGEASAVAPSEARALEDASPVLDGAGLLRRCVNKRELALSLLRRFAEAAPGQAMELGEALENGDLPRATRLAHAMKGSSANIGAPRVAASAKDVEQAAQAGDFERARLAHARLLVELRRLIAASLKPEAALPLPT